MKSEEKISAAPLFPVFLKLHARPVLLVGAGRVAAAKLRPLLEAGARVLVVAPEVVRDIAQAPVTIARRRFEPSDLDGMWFVVAAAPPDVNRHVAEVAEARRVFVNAVDDVVSATAYAPAVLRRAGVTIGISTGGDAPALAGLLREGLQALLPDDLDGWMRCARAARARWIADGLPIDDRRPLLLNALISLYEARRQLAN